MSDTATASVLMQDVRLATDTVGDNNITDAYLLTCIDRSYGKLYRQISTQYQGFFEVEDTNTSLVVDQRTYNLPSDFMHLKGVDIVDGNDRASLRAIQFGDRNKLSNDPRFIPQRPAMLRTNLAYFLQGNTLRIEPPPQVTNQLVITYVPRPTRITSSSDTFDVIAGFDSFIVYDAGISVLLKQERDASGIIQLRQDALQDIINVVSPRITGDAVLVRDEFFGSDNQVAPWL
jgi:hypothetical protein